MSDNAGLTGVIAALINNRRVKNTLRRIENENIIAQGIVRYEPSNIEAFFDEREPVGNMLFSGGLNSIRCRSIARTIECAYLQGYSTVVVHAADSELENMLLSAFGNQYVCAINTRNPCYDPFYKKSNSDISRLVLSSGIKGAEVGAAGKYYLDGIGDFIRAKGIIPYTDMYITCPHMELFDKINELELKGTIDTATARLINSKIVQGEIERSNIENFFALLSFQANRIIAKKSALKYAVNVESVAKSKQILSIDVHSSSNSILLNIIFNEIELEIEKGEKFCVIIDNIPISASDSMQRFTRTTGTNSCCVMASDDVFALFGGDENAFYSYAGKCNKVVISKHASAFSSQKLSEYIGCYDKKEITETFSRNTNYYGQWGLGSSSTADVNVKREQIIKPEEITRMNANEVYIYDKYGGKISQTTVV